jgi:curved DNA-binding protein CbpA
MSELQHTLELFDFLSIDDITTDTLKKAFKNKVLEVHPDKGGDAEKFDKMLAGYLYLTDTIQRISGGRRTLEDIISPKELKELRKDELIDKIFEEFVNEKFNKEFEKHHQSFGHGYKDWLKNKEEDTNLTIGEFDDITIKPLNINEKDFNQIFEDNVKKIKKEPHSMILHPDAMAYVSGQIIGTNIIEAENSSYTSEIFTNPEYTDIYQAFTSENIISDKISDFVENNKTIEDIINERNKEILPFNDLELKEIQDYEKRKIEEQTKQLEKIKNYFNYNEKQSIQLDFNKYKNNEQDTDNDKKFVIEL